MDPAVIGARLASSAVAPLIRKLFVAQGPGAGLVDKPVRLASLVSFRGEQRTLSEKDLHRLAAELVERAVRAAGHHDRLPAGEREAVVHTLARTLHGLGDLDMDDLQAVRLGPRALARRLRTLNERGLRDLSGDGSQLHDAVLESACLHILHFFTQRSTFVARTLVEQSRGLSDLTSSIDVLIDRVPARSAEDAHFEQRYARHIAHKHSRLTIYGLDLHHEREWPLDLAYLPLEAAGTQERHQPTIPADQALAGRERVLLRGVAGSGKTTLIQWLAVSTARQDPGGRMTHLVGRVPFVLPLRTLARGGELPTPDPFWPPSAARSPGRSPPAGRTAC